MPAAIYPERTSHSTRLMTANVVRPFAACVLALGIGACSIPPKPDAPVLRNEAPLAGLNAPASGQWPETEWWKRYGDAQLDGLEQKALGASPTLDEAQKRFGTALRSIETARAAGGVSAAASAQVQRQRLSENGLIPPQFLGFTWYNQGDLSVQFQYDFDFWGKTRAAVQAAVDEARASEAERSAASLLLTTAVADTYFGWQADQARLAIANDIVAAQEKSRSLTAKRVEHGIDSPDYLHQANAQLAATRELAAGLRGSAEIRRAALAALLGVSLAELPTLEARPLPSVETALPDSVGIDLIARRPDIAASRWRVEAALRRADAVRAEFYPDISLGAMVGLQSLDLDKLFNAGSRVAGVGPALHLPLFERASLHAAYGVSQAQLEAAAAQYDASVVDAARDVATQALTLQQIDARQQERARQLSAAQALQQTAAARVQRGLGDDRSLLAAKTQVLQQRDAATALDAEAVSADIALTKALGGGYRMPDSPVATARSGADATQHPSSKSAQ